MSDDATAPPVSGPGSGPAHQPGDGPAGGPPVVRQLRLVVTAEDYDAAVAFYRDALGLPEVGAFADPDGRIVILDAGRATLEIADPPHAAYVDRVEGVDRAGPVGQADPAGPLVRVAFEVTDARGRPGDWRPPAGGWSPSRSGPRGGRSTPGWTRPRRSR